MNDLLRRTGALVFAVALAAGVFALVRSRGEGYGIFDLARRKPFPATVTQAGSVEPFTGASKPVIGQGETELITRLSDEYARLVSAVRPSVVSVNTTRRVAIPDQIVLDPVRGVMPVERILEEPGLGSGVIVSEEGHFITNFHVIDGVSEIVVTTGDGKTYPADVIGVAEGRDIAVLKIRGAEGEVFAALPFGDSSAVRAGEIVLAVGNPFGLGETITRGIISALPRQVSDVGYQTFQTDAVINPGSSGGPLVNTRGEVIAISNLILNPRGGSPSWQGVGFAIPSNDAWATFQTIMSGGRLPVGFLGVGIHNLTDPERLRLGIRDGRGVFIIGIAPGSPGEEAGLQAGDTIVAFGGRSVSSGQELIGLIEARPVGSEVEIEIVRGGLAGKLTAVVGDKAKFLEEARTKISGVMGLALQNLNAYQRSRLRIGPTAPGVLVTDVTPGSSLHEKLAPGDIIFQLNDTLVFDAQAFFRDVDALPFDSRATLYFLRNGEAHSVAFTPTKD